jgi:tetratricopeptide (TPR) repeat protein
MTRVYIAVILVLVLAMRVRSQPNCEYYKANNNHSCYEACLLATAATEEQGSKNFQELFDKAISLCPNFDYAYFEKSVPYIKRGEIAEWKTLIDKAIEIDPALHLRYRAWCRFQFLRDYQGAIHDLNTLLNLTGGQPGYSQNGDYHLEVVRALAYKGLGMYPEAIDILEQHLKRATGFTGAYDYLHLGILKLEIRQYNEAISTLNEQVKVNSNLADNYYYLGKAYYALKKKDVARQMFEKAQEYYFKGYRRRDAYTHPMDIVYLADIRAALEGLN